MGSKHLLTRYLEDFGWENTVSGRVIFMHAFTEGPNTLQ